MRLAEVSRQSLVEIVKGTRLAKIRMIEVGSYAGESAEVFASLPQVDEIWCVDPWKPGYDATDPASASDFAEVEAAFDAVAATHPEKIRKFKGTLAEFRREHPEATPDLVYIDAEHTYEACKRDIAIALEMKPPFMAGHDYAGYCDGVVRAVNDALGRPDFVMDASWIKALTATA